MYLLSFLSDLVVKTQNPSVYDSFFEEFAVPSLTEFVDDDRDKILLYPIKMFNRYLSRMEHFIPVCPGLFVSVTEGQKWLF